MSKKIHVRPSKQQSKVGFAVGIIFCLIGLFIAIPNFGLFGIFWTAVAGWITYTHWRNGYTDRTIDSKIIEIEDTDADNVSVTSRYGYETYEAREEQEKDDSRYKAEKRAGAYDHSDMESRLKSLQSLYDQRLITKEEYDEKKQEILKEL